MIARELTRVLRRRSPTQELRLDDAPGRRRPRHRLLLERQLGRAASVLGGGALPRRRVRRGPGVRARRDGGRLAQGYVPAPASCTRTTIPSREFMRRYFDEYRGLRETVGHVEPRAPAARGAHRRAAGRAATSRYMRDEGCGRAAARAGACARCATMPAARCSRRSARAPSACPPRLARRLSLEGTRRRAGGRLVAGCRHAHTATSPCALHRRRPAPLRRSLAARRDARAAAHRLGDPALPARQRRAHDALHDRATSWSGAGTRARSGSTTPRGMMARRRRRAPSARCVEHFAPLRGGRLQRLRRLARRRRRVRDRLADRLPAVRRSPAAS